MVTILAIGTSDSIVNLNADLTPATVQKFFPHNCQACLARHLAQRSSASVDIIPYTLLGQAFKIDYKGPWTAPDGTPTRSLSGNLYSFTALNLVTN